MTGATAGEVTVEATYSGDPNNTGNRSCRSLTVSSGASGSGTRTTTTTTGNNCPAETITIITTTSATTTSTILSSVTVTSTATVGTTAGQAVIVVAPNFQGNPESTQQVSVFIDGQDVGSATSSRPSVTMVNPGIHTVSCSTVSGYQTPGSTTFTLPAGEEAIVVCVYTPTSPEVTATSTVSTSATTSFSTITTTTTLNTTTETTTSAPPIVNGVPDPSIHNGTADISYPGDSAALIGYALGLINNDRQAYGLPSLSLSSIPSGQQHADSMLYFGYFGHDDPQGYNPYQRYLMLGGSGPMGENIGLAYCTSSPPNSTAGLYLQPCSTTTVDNALAVLEWNMMNNDVQCCANGHRYNILNPAYTKVSIGVEYDSANSLVYFVEDFGTV